MLMDGGKGRIFCGQNGEIEGKLRVKNGEFAEMMG